MCSGMMTVDEKAKRFLKTQLILAVIPTFVTQLFAFYRIRKLAYGIIIELVVFFTDLIIQTSISWPFGMMIVLPISVLIPVYYIRKWTLEFNKTRPMF
jgi:type III secretory pathway component EscR